MQKHCLLAITLLCSLSLSVLLALAGGVRAEHQGLVNSYYTVTLVSSVTYSEPSGFKAFYQVDLPVSHAVVGLVGDWDFTGGEVEVYGTGFDQQPFTPAPQGYLAWSEWGDGATCFIWEPPLEPDPASEVADAFCPSSNILQVNQGFTQWGKTGFWVDSNTFSSPGIYTIFWNGNQPVTLTNLRLIVKGVPGSPTATATGTFAPTATPTPSATAGSGLPIFQPWCPVGTPDFGSVYNRVWLRNCGCVVGENSLLTITPSATASLIPSSTPTAHPDILTLIAQTGTATPSQTARPTATLLPSRTPTSVYSGSISYNAALTATAYANLLATQAHTTPTPVPGSSQESVSAYCATPQFLTMAAAFDGISYVDTVCAINIPTLSLQTPSVTIFGFTLPAVDFGSPQITFCFDRYRFPRIAFVGFVIPVDSLLVFGGAIAFVLRQLGKT